MIGTNNYCPIQCHTYSMELDCHMCLVHCIQIQSRIAVVVEGLEAEAVMVARVEREAMGAEGTAVEGSGMAAMVAATPLPRTLHQ